MSPDVLLTTLGPDILVHAQSTNKQVTVSSVTANTTLHGDLNYDSLGVVDLVLHIEAIYQSRMGGAEPDLDAEDFVLADTVGDFLTILSERV